jgi:hypothetical protein
LEAARAAQKTMEEQQQELQQQQLQQQQLQHMVSRTFENHEGKDSIAELHVIEELLLRRSRSKFTWLHRLCWPKPTRKDEPSPLSVPYPWYLLCATSQHA